jgi:CheY-like chemotaxis protein
MPGGGTVLIRAREAVLDQPDGALQPGRYVRLAVRDTGVGMDHETLKRAVEPFFSTKGLGKGTGLGLAMVHGLAEQSGGTFRLTSAPGQGTTAELWLPASADAPAASYAALPETLRQAPRPATVLLVDDEEIVRLGTAELLKDLGYTVVEANSASQALDQVRAGFAPDVVVTDHMMPIMTGADLAVELRRILPGLPVLLVTGYANLTLEQSRDLVRLAKPFRLRDLAARVAELLEPR